MIDNWLAVIGNLITIIGFYFAYFTWQKTRKDRHKHLIKIIQTQLSCLGPWMGTTGSGYGDELTEEQKFNEANPFKYIYEAATEPLIGITELESISDVPKHVVEEIYQLFYDLVRIRNIQDLRIAYVMSHPELAKNVEIKLNNYIATNRFNNYNKFRSELSKDEKYFLDKLNHWGKIIHCDVIGNVNKSARQHYEIMKNWVENEYKSKIDVFFLAVTLISVSTIILIFYIAI